MTIVAVITLFSCEGNYNNIKKMNLKDNAPLSIAKGMNTKYTDSGKVTVNLIAPLMLDFSNYTFPYNEFPEGMILYFWEDGEKSTVTSDYAVKYEHTNLVDLRGNVKIVTSDSLELHADQLYWDQKNEWLFTDRAYTIKFADGSYNDGQAFNSSQDFTTFSSRKNQGIQFIDKKETTNDL
jgi:LPS export ABC transporter protein LptC